MTDSREALSANRLKPTKPTPHRVDGITATIGAVRAAYRIERGSRGKGPAFDAAVARLALIANAQGLAITSRNDCAATRKVSPFVYVVAEAFPDWPLPSLARRVAKASHKSLRH